MTCVHPGNGQFVTDVANSVIRVSRPGNLCIQLVDTSMEYIYLHLTMHFNFLVKMGITLHPSYDIVKDLYN